MRIIFAGTPDFAVPPLEALAASLHSVVGVYTQPDRPAGRGQQPRPAAVKARAQALNLPVFQPATLRDAAAQQQLRELAPDLMVVVAYGLILPQAVLDIPRHGCINIHASLLPRWRGAAPIQRAFLAGDQETGISIMQMEAGLDTGPVLQQIDCPIEAEDTAARLHDRLARLGVDGLLRTLQAVEAGTLRPVPQDETGVTYAAKIEKAEAALDWHQSAMDLSRRVRAFNPWPVAFSLLQGKAVRIWQARPQPAEVAAPPGTIVGAGAAGIDVATGRGILRVLELQWPGGKILTAAAAANGRALVGQVFQPLV